MPKVYKKQAPKGWTRRMIRLSAILELHKSAATWAGLLLTLLAVGATTTFAIRGTYADQRSQDSAIRAFGSQIKLVMSDWDSSCQLKNGGSYSAQANTTDLDRQFPELERIGREIRVERVGAESLRAFMRLRILATRLSTMHLNHSNQWEIWREADKQGDPPQCVFIMVVHGQFESQIDLLLDRVGK